MHSVPYMGRVLYMTIAHLVFKIMTCGKVHSTAEIFVSSLKILKSSKSDLPLDGMAPSVLSCERQI